MTVLEATRKITITNIKMGSKTCQDFHKLVNIITAVNTTIGDEIMALNTTPNGVSWIGPCLRCAPKWSRVQTPIVPVCVSFPPSLPKFGN